MSTPTQHRCIVLSGGISSRPSQYTRFLIDPDYFRKLPVPSWSRPISTSALCKGRALAWLTRINAFLRVSSMANLTLFRSCQMLRTRVDSGHLQSPVENHPLHQFPYRQRFLPALTSNIKRSWQAKRSLSL
ncbi:hypothetical protein ABKN59_008899 [Abortiporus biennis]